MADVYKRVMIGSAVVGALTSAFYLTASTLAYLDGVGTGIEIAPPAGIVSIIVIVCATVVAAEAWLLRRGLADGTERHLRPAVRVELDDALAEAMPLLVATVAEAVAKRIEPALHGVATGAANRTAAAMREAITLDLAETVANVYRRGQIAGAILHSQSTGTPAPRAATLRPVPHLVGTSEGD